MEAVGDGEGPCLILLAEGDDMRFWATRGVVGVPGCDEGTIDERRLCVVVVVRFVASGEVLMAAGVLVLRVAPAFAVVGVGLLVELVERWTPVGDVGTVRVPDDAGVGWPAMDNGRGRAAAPVVLIRRVVVTAGDLAVVVATAPFGLMPSSASVERRLVAIGLVVFADILRNLSSKAYYDK